MTQIFAPKLDGNCYPASRSETKYEFWNRLDHPCGDIVRSTLQSWLDQYRDERERNKVAKAIQGSNDSVFASRFLEIYLHQIFNNLGYDIEVEKLTESKHCPDFFMSKDGKSFFVEAFRPAMSDEARAINEYMNKLFDEVDSSIPMEGFILSANFSLPTGIDNCSLSDLKDNIPSNEVIIVAIKNYLDEMKNITSSNKIIEWGDCYHGKFYLSFEFLEADQSFKDSRQIIHSRNIDPIFSPKDMQKKLLIKTLEHQSIQFPLIFAIDVPWESLDHIDQFNWIIKIFKERYWVSAILCTEIYIHYPIMVPFLYVNPWADRTLYLEDEVPWKTAIFDSSEQSWNISKERIDPADCLKLPTNFIEQCDNWRYGNEKNNYCET